MKKKTNGAALERAVSAVVMTEPLEPRRLMTTSLVADLNPASFGSNPYDFTTLGDSAYFFTKNPASDGYTLWRTDGTAGGTAAVRSDLSSPNADLHPPRQLTAAGGKLYFLGYDPGHDSELWVSDGTSDGTHFLKDLDPRQSSGSTEYGGFPRLFTEAGGQVVFAANSERGEALWVTDGTAQGTKPLIAENFQNPQFYGGLTRHDGLAYFSLSSDDTAKRGLWRTDGTQAGTFRIHDTPFAETADVGGGVVYFKDLDRATGAVSLWRTDGTVEGTREVVSFDPPDSRPFGGPTELTGTGGLLFFSLQTTAGIGLWRSDGTAAGTVELLTQTPQEPFSLNPENLTPFRGQLLFVGSSLGSGQELWTSDGTPEGTRLLDEINPASSGLGGFRIDPSPFFVAGGQAFFPATDGDHGFELWSTDGTAEGTHMVRDILPGGGDGSAIIKDPFSGRVEAAVVDGRLIFPARSTLNDVEPWSSDGTAEGTAQLVDINSTPQSSELHSLNPAGDGLIFKYDGHAVLATASGDVDQLDEIAPPATPDDDYFQTHPQHVTLHNGVDIYLGSDGLYRSDGTVQGTFSLHAGAHPKTPIVVAGGAAYYVGYRIDTGFELWATDGTVDGTHVVSDVAPGPGDCLGVQSEPAMAAVGNEIFVKFFDDQLWKSDGTPQGTMLVKDFNSDNPFGFDVNFRNFQAVGGELFFRAAVSGKAGLWRSDGSPNGTTLAAAVDVVTPITVFNGEAYFWGRRLDEVNVHLFHTNDSPEGFEQLGDYQLANSISPNLVVFRDRLYFSSSLPDDGTLQLFTTDGTLAGTGPLAAGSPAIIGASPLSLTVFQNRIFFTADDGVHGRELWSTDGTAAGTRMATEINPGPAGSDPRQLTAAGNSLYFVATDAAHGRELWRTTTPVADAGGPYAAVAGAGVQLSAGGEGLVYQWDLDGDGLFGETGADAGRGDETGPNPTFDSSGLAAGDHAVRLRVTDADGLTAEATATVNVKPAPTATLAVSSTSWSQTFLRYLNDQNLGQNGFLVDSLATVPWVGVDRLTFRFDADAAVQEADLSLVGGSSHSFASFNFDAASHTATWTLATPLKAETITLKLNGVERTLRVLPGDVDRSGVVNASDLVQTRNRIGRLIANPGAGTTAYSPFVDLNGDGSINASDLVLVRNRIGASLPPPASLFSGVAIRRISSLERLRGDGLLA